ncbi:MULTISPECIES: Gfo/Idh/MocA family oxidoreductase [unclassified Mesorhizobium]|uniref:Gfo/Idh/MocA family protein n=1 Tax=unclassified Mesorhizobium TaxID=325217 RepID=UPI0033394F96
MTRTLNVAMIGGGFMGKAHALAYAAMPMFFWPAPAIPVCKVVVDVTDALADEGRRRYGFEESSSDWRAVVKRPDIDVVDIVTPNDSHAAIAIAAAEAGKHIICEKPLARGGDEAKTMLDAVKKAGVIHMVAFNYRRTPAVALARQYIEEGRIGKILNFRGTYLQDWSADPDSPLSWRFQKKIAGSGSIGDIGTHVVDLARYLVGEIAEVSALVRTYNKTRPIQRGNLDRLGAAEKNTGAAWAEVDVDDEVVTLLKFADGAIGSLEATRNAYGRNNFITFEIHGTKGSIAFNYERRDELQVMFADDPADARGFRTVYSGPAHPYGAGLWPIPALGIGYSETKIVECFDFFSAIASGRQPSPNFEDGYKTERVADALIESGESGLWTTVRS